MINKYFYFHVSGPRLAFGYDGIVVFFTVGRSHRLVRLPRGFQRGVFCDNWYSVCPSFPTSFSIVFSCCLFLRHVYKINWHFSIYSVTTVFSSSSFFWIKLKTWQLQVETLKELIFLYKRFPLNWIPKESFHHSFALTILLHTKMCLCV